MAPIIFIAKTTIRFIEQNNINSQKEGLLQKAGMVL
jgi:hypothetical protein